MTSPGRFLRSFVPALCVVASAGAARAVDVDVAVVPPGCADPWQRVLTLAATLAEPIGRRGGSFVVTASAPDARAAADVVVFPEADDAGVTRPVAAIPADLVADGDIDVLETPFERIVVVDPLDGVDLLGLIADAARTSGGRFPDVVRRRLPQLRGPGVRALITGEAHAAEHPPGSDRREVAARFDVRVGDDHGVVVAIARSLGGPARLQRALAGRAPGLVLSAGGSRDPACDAALVALGVAAAVPRTVDLARAPLSTSLPESSGARSALPFLAANVVGVDGTRPFPRHRVFDVAGVRVAVIGLVGTGELLRAPASTRAHLRATSGRDAVADVIGGLRRDPAGPPDLIVALSSGDGAERAQLSAVDGLDVVIADFARDDGLAMDVDVVPRAREQSRHDAVFAPVLHRAGLGRITAVFDDAAPAAGMPRALQRLRVAVDPLLDDGQTTAASAALAAPLRALEDERALGGADVLLPAVAKIAALPAAAPLVWGERIAMLGEERRRVPGDAALWTDDLWLRVVGNAVARGVDADVALVRNMRRAPLVAGPLTRATAQAWLVDTGSAVVVDVGGADLLRLADRIASTPPLVDDASGLMSVSGLDPARRVVGGRPIEPLATYRVVVDERLLADARLTGVIDDAHASDRPALAPLVTRALGVGDVDPASLVVDRATERRAEWRLGIPAFELRGSVVRTSPNLLRLAPSLETRAAQRELVAAAAKLLAFATWDAPGFTWDNQLRVQYDATFFADATRGPPVIEPFDDVVGTTELRRDIARFGAAADAPVLVGFVGVTGDGELTPVPLLRRQAQLRQAAGLAWSTTGWLREARLGAVAQQDLADLFTAGDADHVYVDAGVLGLVRFAGPLAGAVALESTTDARFFLPDGDDRPFDLALRAQSVTRVAAPLSASTNGFVFVDVVALSAKPQPATIEWNIVSGVGIAFGGVLRR